MELDLKGMACPQPVLKTREAVLANPLLTTITVLVDNQPASENVARFLASQGFSTQVENRDETVIAVTGEREEGASASESADTGDTSPERRILVMITHNTMGTGDLDLGEKLMISFISTLKEMGSDLWRIVFVNEGVKLAITGAPVLDALKELVESGVSILVCGTCLSHFDLLEAKQVGETTNMLDIITSLDVADKVINL